MQSINIVVSCTAGKNLTSTQNYDDIEPNTEDWLTEAETYDAPTMKAVDLYKGPGADKFRAIKTLLEKEYDVTLWILSAGFGLVREDAQLPGYDATFSSMAKVNRVKPKDYDEWLNEVTQEWLPKNSLILLPNSYLKPFKVLEDPSDHIVLGPFGSLEREMIGCSMIRVQLEASYKIIEYALANNIPIYDWNTIKLETVLEAERC